MITVRSILLILLPFFNIFASFAQKNFIQYSGQYYHYGLHGLNGVRQMFTYHHYIVKGFSVEVHLFTGSGRGKNISQDFKKDYILMSKANLENVPVALRPVNLTFEGVHSYKRISDGLRQDNGWGLSVHYDLWKRKKLNIDIGLGYLVYTTKSIVRNSVMDIRISNPKTLGDTLLDYRITYPASLYTDYRDGAVTSNCHINYALTERLKLGLGINVNRSLWNHHFDLGVGVNFICEL